MRKIVRIFFIGTVFSVSISLQAQWSLTGNNVTATQYLGTVAGDTDPLVVKTNGVERMRITSVGNIGVGTSAPQTLFSLGTLVKNKKLALYDNPNSWYGFGIASGQMRLQIGNPAARFSFFVGDAKEVMTIKGDGNIGIGTTNPGTYKLAVEGRIGAREIQVKIGSWADFVFHDKYCLKPLSEVEKFIKEHKHLPDVPKESEVLKNGIDLGQMNAILLQKIEELTLYMLEFKKENERQAQEILELKKEKFDLSFLEKQLDK